MESKKKKKKGREEPGGRTGIWAALFEGDNEELVCPSEEVWGWGDGERPGVAGERAEPLAS